MALAGLSVGLSEWYRLKNLNPGLFFQRALWFTPNTVPVVGIDSVTAQDILFALRAADNQGRGVADAWLRALQCAQLAHDRLLQDLHEVERNLSFWQRQVSAGGEWSHGAFMLFSRGPRSFAQDVAVAARGLATRRLSPGLTASMQYWSRAHLGLQQQHQQHAAPDVSEVRGDPTAASSSSAPAPPCSATATDLMQQRVLLLRRLRTLLAAALAALSRAAAQLRVAHLLLAPTALMAGAGPAGVGPRRGFAATAAVGAAPAQIPSSPAPSGEQQPEPEGLAGVKAVEDAVRKAVLGMKAALEGLLLPPRTHSPRGPADHSSQPPPAGGRCAAAHCPVERSLALELRDLLALLQLQPPAVRALGLSPEPVSPAVAASSSQRHAVPSREPTAGAARVESAASAFSSAGEAASRAAHGDGGDDEGGSPRGLQLTTGGGSAAAALGAARRAAVVAGPLAPLPATARMPSRFQRFWLRYLAAGGLLLYGGIFLVRHSRLAGSDDLDRWIVTAAAAVHSAFRTHVAEPLAAVRDELFHTFRDRPAIVSSADFSFSRESLLRMLADFAADRPDHGTSAAAGSSTGSSSGVDGKAGSSQSQTTGSGGNGSSSGSGSGVDGGDEAVAAGMAVLMRSYESELQHPLRNLLLGDLARALLIQVQHVKVDGEAAMLRLDQILRANELSLSLLAALPALGMSLALAVGLARVFIPRAPDPKRAAVPARLAMASLEATLAGLIAAEEQRQQQQQQQQQERGGAEAEGAGMAAAAADANTAEELRGLAVYRVHQVYSEVTALYAAADRTSRFSEWRQLYGDLLRLAAAADPRERLAVHQRMMRTYAVFQR